MKRLFVPVLALLAATLIAVPAAAKKLEITKKAGDLTVEIGIEKDPPGVGWNVIEIRLKDPSGRSITEAKVLVQYYMPPMPRMAPMNEKVETKWKKDAYTARMKFIMAGPWIVIIRITMGEMALTTRFQIDVR